MQNGDCMDRNQFLAQPEVKSFVEWLLADLPTQTYHLDFKASKYVPGGLRATVCGFANVLAHYQWTATWIDQSGVESTSSDWLSTKKSLAKLRFELASALASKNDMQALAACLQVLRWGGVRGAVPFLNRLAATGKLITYLNDTLPLLALKGTNRLGSLDADTVQRFDAGLTKIHSLLDTTGSPIYDSRVGAAIGMLHSMFRQQYTGPVSLPNFPSGAARGSQLRNAGLFPNGLKAPQFGSIDYHEWARSQVRLGWSISEVLPRCTWFDKEETLADRCHAFEATLFVLGYDLRCFLPPAVTTTGVGPLNGTTTHATASTGWVPAGHSFTDALNAYRQFRGEGNHPDDRPTFVKWLVKNKNLAASTATAYCFAFSMLEFDLFDRPLAELETIANGGRDGLLTALGTAMLQPFVWSDEREHVCLVDVMLTGIAYRAFGTLKERQGYLIKNGFAGTENAASTLLAVGRNVGKHFWLLDSNTNKPTALFNEFFQDLPLDNCDQSRSSRL